MVSILLIKIRNNLNKRKVLINTKKLGPEVTKKYNPGAIYTSRPLSFLISKCSSIDSSSAEGKKNLINQKIFLWIDILNFFLTRA